MTSLPAVRAVAPRLGIGEARLVAMALDSAFDRWSITSPEARARIVAQMAHECGGFTVVEENLNYSARRLSQVWPNRFPTPESARAAAGRPQVLANKVYNGRMGNRPGSDDGWTFRGSGWMQHTGRAEFARVKAATGHDVITQPDDLRSRDRALLLASAGVSYVAQRAGAREAAARGDVRALARAINGGFNGLADRELLTRRALAAVRNQPAPAGRTASETAARTEAQGKAVAGGGAAAGGTLAADQIARPEPAVGPGGAIAAGLVIVLVLGFVGWRLASRWRKATDAVIRDRIETLDNRSNAP